MPRTIRSSAIASGIIRFDAEHHLREAPWMAAAGSQSATQAASQARKVPIHWAIVEI